MGLSPCIIPTLGLPGVITAPGRVGATRGLCDRIRQHSAQAPKSVAPAENRQKIREGHGDMVGLSCFWSHRRVFTVEVGWGSSAWCLFLKYCPAFIKIYNLIKKKTHTQNLRLVKTILKQIWRTLLDFKTYYKSTQDYVVLAQDRQTDEWDSWRVLKYS